MRGRLYQSILPQKSEDNNFMGQREFQGFLANSNQVFQIVLLPGVTTCIDLLGQILFDPGEVLLAPEPYYYRFANDFGEQGLVDSE